MDLGDTNSLSTAPNKECVLSGSRALTGKSGVGDCPSRGQSVGSHKETGFVPRTLNSRPTWGVTLLRAPVPYLQGRDHWSREPGAVG